MNSNTSDSLQAAILGLVAQTVTTAGTAVPSTLGPGAGSGILQQIQQSSPSYQTANYPTNNAEAVQVEEVDISQRFASTTIGEMVIPSAYVVTTEDDLEYVGALLKTFTFNLCIASSTGKLYQIRDGQWHWVILNKQGELISQEVVKTRAQKEEQLKFSKSPQAQAKLEAFKLTVNQKDDNDIKQETVSFQGSLGDAFTQVE